MSTTEPSDAMTAEDHIREAREYLGFAEEQADAAGYDRLVRRTNDLQAAQVHATLAQTLKAAELLPLMSALVESITPARPETPGTVTDEHPPCPGGCGCRLGTDDADRFECGCDGGCCGD